MTIPKIKICGITRLKDAQAAVDYGVDALGFIFYKKSPRCVSARDVRKIVSQLPAFVSTVGVFVNASAGQIKKIIDQTGINTIQLHGDEPPGFGGQFKNVKVIRAFRVQAKIDFKKISHFTADAYLFDAYNRTSYGGTGQSFDWRLIRASRCTRPLILSGGLDRSNILKAVDTVKPFAVDVSSGVEKSPGIKDRRLMKAFIKILKE